MSARQQLEELVEKYRLLEELSQGQPGRTVARRDAIRAIAERFPGAMREWDELPPEVISRRRVQVEGLVADPMAELPAWVCYAIDLHPRLRAALEVKRWLAGRVLNEELLCEAGDRFGIDRAQLVAIADPTEGRFTEVIFAAVAERHGTTIESLKAALFSHEPG